MLFKFVSLFVITGFAYATLQHDPQALARISANFYSPSEIAASTLLSWTISNVGAIVATQYVIQCIGSPGSAGPPGEFYRRLLLHSRWPSGRVYRHRRTRRLPERLRHTRYDSRIDSRSARQRMRRVC
jgi:hypothetical protein